MAGFELISEPVRTIWMPVDYASTVYVGQFVVCGAVATTSGVKPWAIAGVGDTTTDQAPLGIVVGINNRTPTFNTTYKAEYVAGVATQALIEARETAGGEGKMVTRGDRSPWVQVAVVDCNSIVKGRIFQTSYGTAITVSTVTTAGATGLGYTGSTVGFTAVAYNATYYCRSGANMGVYRVGYDVSATVHTFQIPFPYAIAVGDTLVASNLGLGTCKAMFDSVGTFVDNAAAVGTTNYIWVDVLEINLANAGGEYAIFRINPYQFLALKA